MRKKHSAREWISIRVAKDPRGMILLGILLLNICFLAVAALVISRLAPQSLQYKGFWPSIFYTITMILDAGCIQFVVEDVGQASVALIMVCLFTVLFGMITFTGAVIGYVTNYISDFISSANAGGRRLLLSGHTVILNWNSRGSEIINDLLYSENREEVVVLVSEGRETVEREIEDRLLDTLAKERSAVREHTARMRRFQAWKYERKNTIKNNVTVIVREGDTFSTKKLNDISIKQARAVVILGKDIQNTVCKVEYLEKLGDMEKGNSNTVKTLIQVAELTGAEDSYDDQKVIVEVEDNWTMHLVKRIIAHKEHLGKCNIIPVPVNQILGQVLSQFSVMPELNTVYAELFSNKGAAFYDQPMPEPVDDNRYVPEYLRTHRHAIPLTCMEIRSGYEQYYLANCSGDLRISSQKEPEGSMEVKLNGDYWLDKSNIIILGHNSKSTAIMEGFDAFRAEWNFRDQRRIEQNGGSREILNIAVVDDKKGLEKLGNYKNYPYVSETIQADIFDRETVCDAINRFVDASEGDTSVLILSDDMVPSEEYDVSALTYLIYVQDIISERLARDPDFDVNSIDVIVEILNPKHYDIVHSYSIDNIVISNRYISKMITQLGEKAEIYAFYHDILTYDTEDSEDYESKELYIKKVSQFFTSLPPQGTAAQLIRAVYAAAPENNKAIVLGYVKPGGEMTIFAGNQDDIIVKLEANDKLIVFSNH